MHLLLRLGRAGPQVVALTGAAGQGQAVYSIEYMAVVVNANVQLTAAGLA
jgi:hypothetical protein